MDHAPSLGRFDGHLLWFLGGTLVCAAVAWIAFGVQQEGIAPAILFPLAVGGTLGAALAMLRRAIGGPARRWAVPSAFAWGLLVVIGQGYIGHRHRLAEYHQQLAEQAPLAMVETRASGLEARFIDYLAGLAGREPMWWTLELVLTAAAAALVTAWSTRTGAQNVAG
jgi:hypothetical protein